MSMNTAQRRLTLAGLLAVTLVLVWMSPEPETTDSSNLKVVNPVARAPSINTLESENMQEFVLQPRATPQRESINLFQARAIPKSAKAITGGQVAPKPVIPAPVAPPVPYYFVGNIKENGQAKAYIQEGEHIQQVQEGQMLGGDYKVISIDESGVNVTYLPLNTPQRIQANPNKLMAAPPLTDAQRRAKLAAEEG